MRAPGGIERAPVEPGGWLHLDVSFGCAGDMLGAALLDLGAPVAALRDGLVRCDLIGVGPRLVEDRRGHLRGLHLSFVDTEGKPLEVAAPLEPSPRRRVQTPGRRKGPAPHRDARKREVAPTVAKAEDASDGEEDNVVRLGGDVVLGPGHEGASAAPAPEGHIARWLADEAASGHELAEQLEQSRLEPVPRALARRALRRLLDGYQAATGVPWAEISLPGRAALDVLCDLVGVASLIHALDPGRVTASPVAVSTAPVRLGEHTVPGPSTWVLSCLEGMRLWERELPFECTTPTGAALIWTLAHRSGPRGLFAETGRGTGLGSRDPREVANACRALYGPAPALPGREGEAGPETPAHSVRAVLPAGDRPALMAALRQAGAEQMATRAVIDEEGQAQSELALLAPRDALPAVERALYEAGAAELWIAEVQRHRAGSREVTVALGSAKKGHPVRVLETVLEGTSIRAEPHPDDLKSAAHALGRTLAEARADALSAWRRLRGAERVPPEDR